MAASALFTIALLVTLIPAALATAVTYRPFDVKPITLYGPNAQYAPRLCPPSIVFHDRARPLPELSERKIGLLPSDIAVGDARCTADATMLSFAPIGAPAHLPPQWLFEDSRYTGHAVNFTCGEERFSIRYGYFNDVDTTNTNGQLEGDVVYLDFAVVPYTSPFQFCSYATRRSDGKRPLHYMPFPSQEVWDDVRSMTGVLQTPDAVPPPDAA